MSKFVDYTSNDFHSYCDKEGVIHEVTASILGSFTLLRGYQH